MKKFVLYASSICFIYFMALLITHFIGYSNKIIDFFRELLTIPCLAILVIVFIMAFLGLKKERYTLLHLFGSQDIFYFLALPHPGLKKESKLMGEKNLR